MHNNTVMFHGQEQNYIVVPDTRTVNFVPGTNLLVEQIRAWHEIDGTNLNRKNKNRLRNW